MEGPSQPPSAKLVALTALTFIIHLLTAYYIVGYTTNTLTGMVTDFCRLIGIRVAHHLTESLIRPPYFPLRTFWALFLGWSLGGFLRHKTMLWVWAVPSVAMAWLFVQFPHCPMELFSHVCLDYPSAYALYFGPNCTRGGSCVYQAMYTSPFFSSVGYSLGALLAQRMNWLSRYAEAIRNINFGRIFILSGIVVLTVELALGWRDRARILSLPVPAQYLVVGLLFGLILYFATFAYLSTVIVGLVGRRFSATRWFLNPSQQ